MRVEKFLEKRIYQVSAKEIKNLVAPTLGSEWTIHDLEVQGGGGLGGPHHLVVTLVRDVNRTVENGQES